MILKRTLFSASVDENEPSLHSLNEFKDVFESFIESAIVLEDVSSRGKLFDFMTSYNKRLQKEDFMFGTLNINVLEHETQTGYNQNILISHSPSPARTLVTKTIKIYEIDFVNNYDLENIITEIKKKLKSKKMQFSCFQQHALTNHGFENHISIDIQLYENSTLDLFWQMINIIEKDFARNITLSDF